MNNLPLFPTVLGFVRDVSNRFSTSLQELINGGEITLRTGEIVLRRNVSGASSIQDLLKASDNQEDGVSDFDGNRLPQNRGFVFWKISLGYQTHADADMEAKLLYDRKAIAELANATLRIHQKDRRVLHIPVRAIINTDTGQNVADQYTELPAFSFLVDEQPLSVQLVFPDGVSMPTATTANQYIELRMFGFDVERKSA